jgi:flagellar biosynthesis/type III secretory pathway M-ring protein FliF/YscJ
MFDPQRKFADWWERRSAMQKGAIIAAGVMLIALGVFYGR